MLRLLKGESKGFCKFYRSFGERFLNDDCFLVTTDMKGASF